MTERTRVEVGRREDLGADCASCFGLCCVALAFTRSADFPFDKPAGDPCENLDERDACRVHAELRPRGFTGCTVFDCFGAGQKVSQQTFAGRSWRDDPGTRDAMFAIFPIVRRLHELLWYLEQAISLVGDTGDPAPLMSRFDRVSALSREQPDRLASLDVDAEYDAARSLLLQASEDARRGILGETRDRGVRRRLGPGRDLAAAALTGADLRGLSLRGSLLIGADLSGARLSYCDLLGVDLRNANLAGADLAGAIYLTQMQVSSARGDQLTVLPRGFVRPAHWSAGEQNRP
ncbi:MULTISPECIES: pentapeptide repeat-containing protein [unclassified Cryobacterium]|uniref:pentapeptide repeat-containing protein n=1 Tax=unclassified Cryobacterium TaxID=2649013 RepID=UPI002AB3B627|nr:MULTISPECIES: pentapeptide repeat-containing protein [unclassified Cryobacterium]MDY7528049.1 pentapeptide repeat-containing protein [Cryobacterium sp. 10C2]MDY7556194.1 pentapeptide repeat-containing protein [Cryobacterium sp. 10C3]MEB0002607.1 pentapeptide repeat-containing protein [Cryobacterium sp. RTC2.1]MEB0200432.1 pentapeptide repeat-containing protein [Cryobacterium sp. 5I3]MEB0291270.1 pentapeptide repeat-containing protein [Cryobacterium sp. 10C2]